MTSILCAAIAEQVCLNDVC